MILTEQPIGFRNHNFRKGTWGRGDDVRRSIDVLDQVLSEFDDIDPFYGDGNASPVSDEHLGDQEVPEGPPPVDRSLKPKNSPPLLPQKNRRKSFEGSSEGLSKALTGKLANVPANSQRSLDSSKRSEVSSHEYQEINADFCPSPSQGKSNEERSRSNSNGQRQRHHSKREQLVNQDGVGQDPRMVMRNVTVNSPLRKSRSGDVSIPAEDGNGGRSRKTGRRHPHQRRGRSSERFLDHPNQPFYDPRRQPETGPVDPRLIDPNFVDPGLQLSLDICDPRLMDPRFFDRRLVDQNVSNQRFRDPRFIDPNLCDPIMMEPPFLGPPVFINDNRIPYDGPQGACTMNDPMQFPHLMTHPGGMPGPFSLPPHNGMEYHPHTIPPYDYPGMEDHLLHPEYPFHPMDPRFQGFNPPVNGYDPRLNPPHPGFPMDYPMDFSFEYQHELPLMDMHPRERFSFDEGMRGVPHPNGPMFPGETGWLPPTPEEARKTIQRIVRKQSHEMGKDEMKQSRGDLSGRHKISKVHGDVNSRPKPCPNVAPSSDSSGRSSPLVVESCPVQKEVDSKPPSVGSRRNSLADPGTFKVGEIVRKDGKVQREFGGKETVSLPRFISGGKDSGFDEGPVAETPPSLTSSVTRGGTPVGGGVGGFVVAGVFSDSSKMYIPAPPSPVPDYDRDRGDSDGEDFHIPQEPFYVCSKQTKDVVGKSPGGVKRGSLSDDSLQEESRKDKMESDLLFADKNNSLQTMMAQFHMGLPPPRAEGHFSDDSLEEEESSIVSPSRRSTVGSGSQRPESMESLFSMDGSTTSFDYMSDMHQKPNIKMNDNKLRSPTKGNTNNNKQEREIPLKGKNNNKKTSIQSNKQNVLSRDKNEANILNDNNMNEGIESPSAMTKSSSVSELTRQLSSESSKDSKKKVPKFDTIRNLIKEGLIEGLDETPPDFAPPPPPRKVRSSSTSEERADSGLGSTASTNNRVDESTGSDSFSDKLSNTPPSKAYKNCSLNDILKRRTSSPPPLPPPRDSSVSAQPSMSTDSSNTSLVRNQSWLFKNEKPVEQRANYKQKYSKNYSESITNSSAAFDSKSNSKSSKKEQMTHVDDHLRNFKNNKSTANGRRESLATQYATPQDNHQKGFNSNIFLENTKNLNKRPNENSSLIYDDQASVSSHGSRSGRFFSRFAESMKSSSRTNSPISAKNTTQQRKKSGAKFHGDFIRAPNHTKSEAPQPPLGSKPPQYKNISDPSSIVPLTRDGSGRFRSIEDLADIGSAGKSLELRRAQDDLKKKRKKNATLPPNLTPADMLQQERERKRSAYSAQGIRNKDDVDPSSKFKFNIFKGFWRRNKYSFDKM